MIFEPIARPLPRLGEVARDFRAIHLVNGLVAFLFAATGPVALILTIGISGGLKESDLASWIFIGFFGGGVLSIIMSVLYRQPLAMAWTIPGTALVGPALANYSFPEVIGTFLATGVVMIVLGVTGWFKKLMDAIPMPIVMAMVAGIFLRFGVLAVDGFEEAWLIAVPTLVAFVAVSLMPSVAKVFPPVLAALIGGTAATIATNRFSGVDAAGAVFASPTLYTPAFSVGAMVELVLPLTIAVLALQNAQGIAVLRSAKHDPPANTITIACGAGSLVFGALGAVCTCLTGPVNAILSASGERRHHYIGGLCWAVFAILFGLFAPMTTRVALALPTAFIYVLGGLAMLRVLESSFTGAFRGSFTLGALVTFVITATDLIPSVEVKLLGVGAPFWGLVFGVVTSWLFERDKPAPAAADGADGAKPPAPVKPTGIKLISPVPSPFTRKVQIALAEKRVPHTLVKDVPDTLDNILPDYNPLGKPPVLLIEDSISLFDSRVIVEYLDDLTDEPRLVPASAQQRTWARRCEVLADGVCEAVAALYIEAARPEKMQRRDWIRRLNARVEKGVAAIAQDLGARPWCVSGRYSIADIAVGCMLEYLDQRRPDLNWRTAHPNLARLAARLRQRPAWQTKPAHAS